MQKFFLTLMLAFFVRTEVFVYAQSVQPGLWKAKASFKLEGLALPPNEDEGCIGEDEAKDVKGTITKGLKKQGCQIKAWTVKGKNFEADLVCKNKDIDAKGKIRGQFSAKNYNLTGEATGTYKSLIPTNATITLTGEWVRACKI